MRAWPRSKKSCWRRWKNGKPSKRARKAKCLQRDDFNRTDDRNGIWYCAVQYDLMIKQAGLHVDEPIRGPVRAAASGAVFDLYRFYRRGRPAEPGWLERRSNALVIWRQDRRGTGCVVVLAQRIR